MSIRIGVIGAGIMGSRHVKNLVLLTRQDTDFELSGIYDIDCKRSHNLSQELGIKNFSSLEEFADNVDAASVVCSTSAHFVVGSFLLSKGISCLIEKPLALSLQECKQLVTTAERNKVILQPGHLELFNPAVITLLKFLTNRKPVIYGTSSFRMSPSSARITDSDVINDLMIHDIYVITEIMQDTVTSVSADGFKDGKDSCSALLHFAKGSCSCLNSSRLECVSRRYLDIFSDIGYLHLDYYAQTLELQNAQEHTSFPVQQSNSLLAELKHFMECVKHRQQPLCDGKKALQTIHIIHEIENKLSQKYTSRKI